MSFLQNNNKCFKAFLAKTRMTTMTTTMTTTTAKTMTTATMTMMTTTSLAMNSSDDYDKNDNKKTSTLTTTTAQWTLSPKHLQPDASKKILKVKTVAMLSHFLHSCQIITCLWNALFNNSSSARFFVFRAFLRLPKWFFLLMRWTLVTHVEFWGKKDLQTTRYHGFKGKK